MIFYFLMSVLPNNAKYKAYTPKLQQYVIARGNLNSRSGKVYFLYLEYVYMYVDDSVIVLNLYV